jgi:hypothetical protein
MPCFDLVELGRDAVQLPLAHLRPRQLVSELRELLAVLDGQLHHVPRLRNRG